LLADIDILALKYRWQYDTILDMPYYRRRLFVKICMHRAAAEKKKLDEVEAKQKADQGNQGGSGGDKVSIEKLFPGGVR